MSTFMKCLEVLKMARYCVVVVEESKFTFRCR